MANDSVCIFCGERPGMFKSETILVGGTSQLCCKACAKEVSGLSELELCRKVLRTRRAQNADRIETRVELITQSEEIRPKCSRCGTPMKFGSVTHLDDSPLRDGLLSSTFDVLPCYCPACYKLEFFLPQALKADPKIAFLHRKDVTGQG